MFQTSGDSWGSADWQKKTNRIRRTVYEIPANRKTERGRKALKGLCTKVIRKSKAPSSRLPVAARRLGFSATLVSPANPLSVRRQRSAILGIQAGHKSVKIPLSVFVSRLNVQYSLLHSPSFLPSMHSFHSAHYFSSSHRFSNLESAIKTANAISLVFGTR